MRRRTAAALALLALVGGSTAGCADDEQPAIVSTRVDPVQATTLSSGDAELRIPPGSASGGTVTLGPARLPDDVPSGVKPLGPAAAVLLEGGSLTAPATISFAAPDGLGKADLPVVVWRQRGGGWTWLPITWRDHHGRLAAEFTDTTAGFLAVVEPTAWLNGFVDDFVTRVGKTAGARPPACTGPEDPAAAPASGSDDGTQVRWCLGVEGDHPVLKITNDTRLFQEVDFPADWQAPVAQGITSADVRDVLAVGRAPAEGRLARLLGPGKTLALALPPGTGSSDAATGAPPERIDVTAAVTPTAWAASVVVAGADVYAEVADRIDHAIGRSAGRAARGLPALLARGLPTTDAAPEALPARRLHDCLAAGQPVVELDRSSAAQLMTTSFRCVAAHLRRTTAPTPGGRATATLVARVTAQTLTGLSAALDISQDAWAAVPGEAGDSTFRIWLGVPPPQQFGYDAAPLVFSVGDDVAASSPPEWTPEFRAYVQERLQLLASSDTASGCPDGSFGVRRLTSDGYALATQVDCDEEVHQVVLERLDEGWHEIDDADASAPDELAPFSCDVMTSDAVPAFVAGDSCLVGTEPQDYP